MRVSCLFEEVLTFKGAGLEGIVGTKQSDV